MSNNNSNSTSSDSNTQPNSSISPPNHHHPSLQNQNFMHPFMPNMMMQPPPLLNRPPFMNAANHHPMCISHVRGLGPHNNNPTFPLQGQQFMHRSAAALSQLQHQILAQYTLNMLHHPNVNMPNMNQQFPMMQGLNLSQSQLVPFGSMHLGPHPIFVLPNQVPHAMVPRNPLFLANSQFGYVPGIQVRPQENPNSNIRTNFPDPSWKGSPSKNCKSKPNREGCQGGFQKSKFPDTNSVKSIIEFPKEDKGKGANNLTAENFGLNSEELQQEPKRSFSATYSEQVIQQWREERRKNHPFSGNIQKNSANQGLQSEEEENTFNKKRKFEEKLNNKPDRKSQFAKKLKLAGEDLSESEKNGDIEKDNSNLFEVVKEIGSEGDGEKNILEHDTGETIQKIVNRDSDNDHDGSEDEESDDDDDNESIVPIDQHKEPSTLVKRQCDKSESEEGKIIG